MKQFIKIKTYYWDKTENKTKQHRFETLLSVSSILEITPSDNGMYGLLTTTGHRTASGNDLDALFNNGSEFIVLAELRPNHPHK